MNDLIVLYLDQNDLDLITISGQFPVNKAH